VLHGDEPRSIHQINHAKYYSHEPLALFSSSSLYNLTLIFSNLQPKCQTLVLSKALTAAPWEHVPSAALSWNIYPRLLAMPSMLLLLACF
jgi:hypothetical protein